MPANYVLLEKITVGAAGASSVTFSSIPQTGYTDLVVKISNRNGTTGLSFAGLTVAFNGSSSSFTFRTLGYYGGNIQSYNESAFGSNSVGYAAGSAATANTFSNVEIYIPNYTSSINKCISVDGANGNMSSDTWFHMESGTWASSAAITSLTFNTGAMVAGSTFYLYGVAKLGTTPAIVPYATGGDIIETDGTYWYHAFLSSGTFTPQKGISCDVLTIAGGAGGGWYAGGGGGAGGLLYSTAVSASSPVTVTVGAGGASRTTSGTGNAGSNSVFSALTATGGGGGGGNGNGATGGSGGGASGLGTYTGGSATSGQGFAGGTATGTPAGAGGSGGGGAGAVGGNGTGSPNETPGAGGAGTNTYSSWLSVIGLGVSGFIAGGGGGAGGSLGQSGAAGSGGGGAGGQGTSVDGVSGTANTGSGGGGAWFTGRTSGAGGSGLVVVRYAV